ncbi:MAG: hypothetical protein ACYDEP_07695 [Acidimicrobiales bacterium]
MATLSATSAKVAACPGASSDTSVPAPAPTSPNTLASWNGVSIPITRTGTSKWTSPVVTVRQLPTGFELATKVVGNGSATIDHLRSYPSGGAVPLGYSLQLRVSFNVTCVTGTPSLLLWSVQADGS